MKELGPGFLQRVSKNSLLLAIREKQLHVETEKAFEVIFKGKVIGKYNADLVVEKTVIIELKCCESLVKEHQAQLFNYLTVSRYATGLLVNFLRRKLAYERITQLSKNQW